MRQSFNFKRRLAEPPASAEARARLHELALRVAYSGNPEHKRSPGDFGLHPPSASKPIKTLCDAANIFRRAAALEYLRQGLRQGLRRGLVSKREVDGWPQNVWAVTEDGMPLEAQRDADGSYHGYPMPADDPMHEAIRRRWGKP